MEKFGSGIEKFGSGMEKIRIRDEHPGSRNTEPISGCPAEPGIISLLRYRIFDLYSRSATECPISPRVSGCVAGVSSHPAAA
jgi:hypothetical protein